MVSVLANYYDKKNKPLNGTHKSHVHSTMEVSLFAVSFMKHNNETDLDTYMYTSI